MCKMTDFDLTVCAAQEPASQAENSRMDPADAIL
jgi:hypothetical protein